MTMLLALCTNLPVTAVAKENGIHLNTSPFQGGQNKNAILTLQNALAGGAVISIDGSGLIQDTAPASGDASWASIATLQAGSPVTQEILLPVWIRVNITTLGTGTATINLQGVQ